ncbi:MAG TPA: hypothetical protein P5572_17175 [Phycisphaerae bacterium]|nr:hypothetical protein [Phycisphaerae bacterium]
MHPIDICEHLRRRPFVPIRVHMSDGTHYDVRHPEMALISAREIVIAISPGAEGLPEKSMWCDPIHVTRIEPINGQPAPRKPKKR